MTICLFCHFEGIPIVFYRDDWNISLLTNHPFVWVSILFNLK